MGTTIQTREGWPDCIEWHGYIGHEGYGIEHGKLVHREAWIKEFGPITNPKLFVLHGCDNRKCYNVDHLHLGTKHHNNLETKYRNRGIGAPKGDLHGRHKLSEADVLVIKKRIAAGEIRAHLAREYGVTHACINRIKNGTAWSWLEIS